MSLASVIVCAYTSLDRQSECLLGIHLSIFDVYSYRNGIDYVLLKTVIVICVIPLLLQHLFRFKSI